MGHRLGFIGASRAIPNGIPKLAASGSNNPTCPARKLRGEVHQTRRSPRGCCPIATEENKEEDSDPGAPPVIQCSEASVRTGKDWRADPHGSVRAVWGGGRQPGLVRRNSRGKVGHDRERYWANVRIWPASGKLLFILSFLFQL
jgi:hypothetical protein